MLAAHALLKQQQKKDILRFKKGKISLKALTTWGSK